MLPKPDRKLQTELHNSDSTVTQPRDSLFLVKKGEADLKLYLLLEVKTLHVRFLHNRKKKSWKLMTLLNYRCALSCHNNGCALKHELQAEVNRENI